jgi:hypothetical protein
MIFPKKNSWRSLAIYGIKNTKGERGPKIPAPLIVLGIVTFQTKRFLA